MAFNILEFLAQINQYSDTARTDKFDVKVGIPNNLLPIYQGYGRMLTFQCESAEIPGRTISTFETRTYGPQLKFPYQSLYSDLSLTFYCIGNKTAFGALSSLVSPLEGLLGQVNTGIVGAAIGISGGLGLLSSLVPGDSGLPEKTFFDDWMEIINPTPASLPFGQFNMGYKEDYASPDLTITHYDTNGNRTYAVKFIDAYPIDSHPLSLSWADDSIIRLTVSFAYTRWERITNKFDQTVPAPTDVISTAQSPDILGTAISYLNTIPKL